MTPLSFTAPYNLSSFARKRTALSGLVHHVRIFSLISLVVLFAFTPCSSTKRVNDSLNGSQVPETTFSETQSVFSMRQTVGIRKRVSYARSPGLNRVPEQSGSTKFVRTVTVPHLFSYPVEQQPEDNPYYVSSSKDLVTEFRLARQYKSIGLLAHNNLAGSKFKDLTLGQEIFIFFEDGHAERYTISAIHRFQALESTKTESQFVDLDSGKTLSATEVFNWMYTGAPHLTFQTCIKAKGDASWGRLFLIATPDPDFE